MNDDATREVRSSSFGLAAGINPTSSYHGATETSGHLPMKYVLYASTPPSCLTHLPASQSAFVRGRPAATCKGQDIRERHPLNSTVHLILRIWVPSFTFRVTTRPLRIARAFSSDKSDTLCPETSTIDAWNVPERNECECRLRIKFSELPKSKHGKSWVTGRWQLWHRSPPFALGTREEQTDTSIIPPYPAFIVRLRLFSRPTVFPSVRADTLDVSIGTEL